MQRRVITWHTNKEVPQEARLIMVTDGTSIKFDGRYKKMNGNEMWAYFDEMLPHIDSPIKPRFNPNISQLFNKDF